MILNPFRHGNERLKSLERSILLEMQLGLVEYKNYTDSIARALDRIGAARRLASETKILVKPNLINISPHPVTTPPAFCRALIQYIRKAAPSAQIVIAEGCGASDMETDQVFHHLGYTRLSEELGVRLIDLNHAPVVKKQNDQCPFFQEMFLPEVAFTHFVISAPVLKAHSLAGVTGAMKNMMGFAPPRYYSGRFGIWKKAVFHEQMQQSIIDLNTYRAPDLSVMDATIGLPEYHLGGRHCNPKVNRILAGWDATALDRKAAELLGINWQEIQHLS